MNRNVKDNTVEIKISEDRKKAWLIAEEGARFNISDLEIELKRAGVVEGINPLRLEKAAQATSLTRAEPIAECIPPLPGKDAEIKHMVSDEVKPIIRENGSFDFRELNLVKNITQGQPLAEKIPPKIGPPGFLVTGEEIPAIMGNDLALTDFAGPGTAVSERDENIIVAAIDGVYSRDDRGKVSVKGIFTIEGDIDYNTGNIHSDTDVVISGDINSSFSVYCGGNLFVGGLVDDAEITVKEDLSVNSGITKGEAPIEVRGELSAMYIYSRSSLKAGSFKIREVVSFSCLASEGDVTAQHIVGGEIVAKGNIIAEETGSDRHESRTVLVAGYDREKIERRRELETHFDELKAILMGMSQELEKHKEWLIAFKKHSDKLSRDTGEMDDSEMVSAIREKIRARLEEVRNSKRRYDEIRETLVEIEKEKVKLEQELRANPAQIRISGTVFAGVKVAIGDAEPLLVAKRLNRAAFKLDSDYNVTQIDF